ncbi:hypothetical protein HHI36_006000 [Cryptolaemus montrouzieri]|uniref:Ionotropic receptor n=1 Tax=Cryptolaemus montrouzieri TaxID=559131 RepID=A0ABD2NW10_9CUCU
MEEHFSDLRPEIYIVDLDQMPAKEIMKIVTKCYNYNPEAIFIVKTKNGSFGFEKFSPRFIKQMIQIRNFDENNRWKNLNGRFLNSLENEKFCADFIRENPLEINVMKKNTTLKVCHGFRVYFTCAHLNCSEKGGMLYDITEMIKDYMKLDIEYVQKERIFFLKPSELLLSGDCDWLVSEILISIDGGEHNFIYTVNDDYERWVVPTADRVPKWKYLFKVFSGELWFIWFSLLLVVSLVWGSFDYIFSISKSTTMKNEIIQTGMVISEKCCLIIKMFLDQTVKMKILHFHQMFLINVLFLIFMMNNLYKGRFTYLLLGTNHYPEEIKTFDDILDKNMYLGSAIYRIKQLEDQFPKIKNYSFFLPATIDTSKWLNFVAFRKDTAILISTTEIKYISQNYLDEDGMSLMRVLDLTVTKVLKGAVYLRGNPILSNINKSIYRLRDHGFVARIISKYENFDHYVKKNNPKDPQIMTCYDLTGPLAIWLMGILSTTFVFFLEWMKLI